MEDNNSQPYPAPMPAPPPASFGAPPAPSVDRASLRDLAGRQRAALIAGLANAIGGALAYTHAVPDGITALLSLIIAGFIIVAAFRLAQRVSGTGIAILSGVAMLIPFVWIIVLLALSSKATNQLRAVGVQVGFFGANPSSI
jgi:hypothetical protein